MEQNHVVALEGHYLFSSMRAVTPRRNEAAACMSLTPSGMDETIRRIDARRGIGAERAIGVNDPIANGDILDAGPNRLDDARPFVA